MIDEDWSGFGAAFTEVVRPAVARGRYGRRLFAVAVAALLAMSISALMYGALGGGSKTPAGPAAAGPNWTAVAGPTCAAASTGFTAVGYSTAAVSAQTTGWSTSASGGYTGGGCTGGFLSMPMSGNATAYDSSRTALWNFDPGSRYAAASCRLSVYVPDNAAIGFVGGDPAYYYFYGTRYSAGSKAAPLGSFQVGQVSQLGDWVSGPAFHITTGQVTVRLIDAGVDQTTATMDAHLAAAQVRLTCQAS